MLFLFEKRIERTMKAPKGQLARTVILVEVQDWGCCEYVLNSKYYYYLANSSSRLRKLNSSK